MIWTIFYDFTIFDEHKIRQLAPNAFKLHALNQGKPCYSQAQRYLALRSHCDFCISLFKEVFDFPE